MSLQAFLPPTSSCIPTQLSIYKYLLRKTWRQEIEDLFLVVCVIQTPLGNGFFCEDMSARHGAPCMAVLEDGRIPPQLPHRESRRLAEETNAWYHVTVFFLIV
jgi:hypothetical protein